MSFIVGEKRKKYVPFGFRQGVRYLKGRYDQERGTLEAGALGPGSRTALGEQCIPSDLQCCQGQSPPCRGGGLEPRCMFPL